MKIRLSLGPFSMVVGFDVVEDKHPTTDTIEAATQRAVNAANRADQAASRAEAAEQKIENPAVHSG